MLVKSAQEIIRQKTHLSLIIPPVPVSKSPGRTAVHSSGEEKQQDGGRPTNATTGDRKKGGGSGRVAAFTWRFHPSPCASLLGGAVVLKSITINMTSMGSTDRKMVKFIKLSAL